MNQAITAFWFVCLFVLNLLFGSSALILKYSKEIEGRDNNLMEKNDHVIDLCKRSTS